MVFQRFEPYEAKVTGMVLRGWAAVTLSWLPGDLNPPAKVFFWGILPLYPLRQLFVSPFIMAKMGGLSSYKRRSCFFQILKTATGKSQKQYLLIFHIYIPYIEPRLIRSGLVRPLQNPLVSIDKNSTHQRSFDAFIPTPR